MKTLGAALFDLDGTLLDSAQDFLFILNTMRAERQMPPISYHELKPTVSEGAAAMVAHAFPKLSDTAPLKAEFLERYHQAPAAKSELYQGVEVILRHFEEQGTPWGIITNKPRHFTQPILAHFDLLERCDCLVCPEDVTHSKPAPDALLLAADILSTEPDTCIYVGDHQRDITAGNRAGMFTIAALWGYIGEADDTTQWQADTTADRIQDILPALENHFSIAAL